MDLYKILFVTGLVALFAYESESFLFGRRRRRWCHPKDKKVCEVGPWRSWGPCDRWECGHQRRERYQTSSILTKCLGPCPHLIESRGCNKKCKNGGILQAGFCKCTKFYEGMCCESLTAEACNDKGGLRHADCEEPEPI